MPKHQYRDSLHMNKNNEALLSDINDIIDEYAQNGYVLTLRQLYYQLVSRAVIPNEQKEYAKLSTLLVKGRMAGIVDWEAIEDRLRVPDLPYWVHDIPDAIQDTINSYRLDRQKDQNNYTELWVEKDALSGVLKRITHHFHVRLMVNRGYSSCTAMHDAYKRLAMAKVNEKKSFILYLGDHDPSGLDMVRDISDRLEEFGLNYCPYIWYEDDPANMDAMDFTIQHIALTQGQIKQYNPPPNPTKVKDPRAKDYLGKFGQTCWEVDALPPNVLNKLVTAEIEKLMDMRLFNAQIEQEKKDVAKLEDIADQMK